MVCKPRCDVGPIRGKCAADWIVAALNTQPQALGLGSTVQGFGFRVWGLGFRVERPRMYEAEGARVYGLGLEG